MSVANAISETAETQSSKIVSKDTQVKGTHLKPAQYIVAKKEQIRGCAMLSDLEDNKGISTQQKQEII
jgi:hypothetical protein